MGTTVYVSLKKEFSKVAVTFHLQRLEREYENIHSSVK